MGTHHDVDELHPQGEHDLPRVHVHGVRGRLTPPRSRSTGLGGPTFNNIGAGSLNFTGNTNDYEFGRG